MGAFHRHPHKAAAPTPVAHLAFYLATGLAGVSALLTAFYQRPYPWPLMLACLSLLLGLWRPLSFLPLYNAWARTLYIVAKSLVTLYWFLYILPAGLFQQLRGHDPLQRRFNPASTTYWQAPQTSTNMRKLG